MAHAKFAQIGVVSLTHWMHHGLLANQGGRSVKMRKQHWLAITLIVAALAACASAYWWTGARQQNSSVLSFLPRDPAAVIYIDVAALRKSPFLAQLAVWLPQPIPDSDYAQFVADTGFNFERDLDHLAIAYVKSTIYPSSDLRGLILIGEGRFDRQKITAYAMRKGTKYVVEGHEVIQWPGGIDVAGPCITFLSDRLVAISEGQVVLPDELPVLAATPRTSIGNDWRERFLRLAGSPVFAVIRQEAGAALADKAAGGFRSPQLSSLLDQLQWLPSLANPKATSCAS